MLVGERLRTFREDRKLSQGDMEKRTGLLGCYISRVENGHTVPSVQTLERLARGIDIPLFALLYDGEEPPKKLAVAAKDNNSWGHSGRQAQYLAKLSQALAAMEPNKRQLLLRLVQVFVRHRK